MALHSVADLRSRIWPEQMELFERLLKEQVKGQASPDLCEATRHQILGGGKRLRALIPYFVCDFFRSERKLSEPDLTLAKYLGLAVELLHSATLGHDDVMDGDRVRRNAPTVWVKHGIPQAINTGDLLFYLGEDAVHASSLSDSQKVLALKYLSKCMQIVIHGQALEIELRRDQVLPTQDTYETIVVGKTGGLFALSLIMGGISAQLSDCSLECLFDLGMKLGEAFQIQDDLIDVLGNKGRDVSASDLWEGKPSWLVSYAAQRLTGESKEAFCDLLYRPREIKSQSDVDRILGILETTGALAEGRKTLKTFAKISENLRAQFSQPGPQTLPGELIEGLVTLIQAPSK